MQNLKTKNRDAKIDCHGELVEPWQSEKCILRQAQDDIFHKFFKFKCAFLILLLVILFSDSIMAFAAGAPVIPKPGNLPGITVETQKTATGPQLRAKILELVPTLLYSFIGVIAISSVLVLIVSGIMFLMAYGNEETVGTAKKAATYAIVGLLIAIFSYAIVKIIVNLPLPQ